VLGLGVVFTCTGFLCGRGGSGKAVRASGAVCALMRAQRGRSGGGEVVRALGVVLTSTGFAENQEWVCDWGVGSGVLLLEVYGEVKLARGCVSLREWNFHSRNSTGGCV
jgi:hypothetical protein